MMEKKKVFFF